MDIIKEKLTKFKNTILPSYCHITNEKVIDNKCFSSEIWSEIPFISSNTCLKCGSETVDILAKDNPRTNTCQNCFERKFKFAKHISPFIYKDPMVSLILSFKHGDQTNLHKLFSHFMYEKIKTSYNLNEIDFITYVPLSLPRYWQRQYNQSYLLAYSIFVKIKKTHKQIKLISPLSRQYFIKSQGGLSTNERIANVKKSFALSLLFTKLNKREVLKKKNILLIDDVFTTGATLNACSEILQKTGVKKIFCATIAKTNHFT